MQMVSTRRGKNLHCDRSTRLGQFFLPAADEHPGLSGFSLLSEGREAFIVRLAAIDLAERSLDMQYYIWEGDTTGRIILDRVMMAADRGVRVRLLVDDPYYKPSDRAFRSGWSLTAARSQAALHTKAMAFDREAVFIGSFNLDPRSAVINTEAGLYIESPEVADRLTAYMATGVMPANSYRVLLDPNGEIVWETVRDGQKKRYRDEPETGFRRRMSANLLKLLPIDSQL
jgi:putative cardiolipin synthase